MSSLMQGASGSKDEPAAQRLRQRLIAQLRHTLSPKAQLELSLTDNRCTMISVRREPGRYRLRLHHMFAEAGPDIVAALGRYVTRAERAASDVLGKYITANQERIIAAEAPVAALVSPRPARPIRTESRGRYHDLRLLLNQLNADYFDGAIKAEITWGQRKRVGAVARRRKSLQLGSYSVEDALIRIHPTLDRSEVPGYFVAWIIYHEMLHQKHSIPIVDGRRRFHTREFLAQERLFDDYELAHLWERQNQRWLLWY